MAGISTTGTAASFPLADRRVDPAHQTLLRIGGWLGVIGGLLALVANGLHPHPSDFHLQALLQAIAQNPAWALIHLTLILGILLILGALVAITLSIEQEPGATVARFACVAALLGGALILVSTSIDGFAMNQLAHSWLSAPATEKAGAFQVAEGFEEAQYAIYSLSVFIFLGIGILLYGLATLLGSTYPKALGWLATLSGAGASVVGVAQALGGPTLRATEMFFVLFSMGSTLWIMIMGVLMLRLARTTEAPTGTGAPAPVSASLREHGPAEERGGYK